jgi:hypothetical protein
VINRIEFHSQLEDEFRRYVEQLRLPAHRQLRDNFRKKMDYICTM